MKLKELKELIIDNLKYIVLFAAGILAATLLGNDEILERARKTKEKKGEVQEGTAREKEAAEEDLEEAQQNRKERQEEAEELDNKMENHFD